MKVLKNLTLAIVVLSSAYFAYRWDQARKLDNYFIDRICLDAELQTLKGEHLLNGPLFDQTCTEMKEHGYNPYEIQQIVFQGYDKALKKEDRKHQQEVLSKTG